MGKKRGIEGGRTEEIRVLEALGSDEKNFERPMHHFFLLLLLCVFSPSITISSVDPDCVFIVER